MIYVSAEFVNAGDALGQVAPAFFCARLIDGKPATPNRNRSRYHDNRDVCVDNQQGVALMTTAEERPWTFVTNHTRVLIVIAQTPDIRVRDIAGITGITERSTQRIVAELEEGGYLTHPKVGRRNHYQVRPSATLRHPRERDVEIGALIQLLSDTTIETESDNHNP